MPITIKKYQPLSFYLNKYHIPILTNLLITIKSRLRFNKKYKRINLNDPVLFKCIEIETYNRCNFNCSFCPAARDVDIRKPTYMKEELFSKIIDGLKELNYSGKLNLHHNNEPLLDKRLEQFIKESVEKLPKAEVNIFTNGSLLTIERMKSLYNAGLRKMLIDNYNEKLEVLPNIQKVLDSIKNTEIEKNMEITVWLRYKNVVLTNRAGDSPNKKNISAKIYKFDKNTIAKRGCEFPFIQFNINPDGKVHICCADVYYSNIIGDLTKEKIIDIWKGKKLTMIRQELLKNGRKNIHPCRNCDKL
jgi:radical SAM protein with 4Fe4S-binding SPASM domain